MHLVLGSWLETDSSDSLLRRRRAGVSDLEFDSVSWVVLPRSDSFASDKLLEVRKAVNQRWCCVELR